MASSLITVEGKQTFKLGGKIEYNKIQTFRGKLYSEFSK